MNKETFWDTQVGQRVSTYIKAFVLIIIIVGALAYFGVFDNEFNPETDVCEYEVNCNDVRNYDLCNTPEKAGKNDGKCLGWRKLTSTELLEKSCNENPNSEDCLCLVYEESFNITTQSRNQSQRLKPFYEKEAYDIKYNCNIIDDTLLNCKTCVSSTPKLKPIEINIKEEKCVEHTFDYFPDLTSDYSQGLYCDRNNESTYLTLSKISQEQWDRFCCIKKEKLSEVEKLMDKDCNWLLKDMMDSCGQYKRDTRTICEEKKQHYTDLKTAWRAKECII